MPLLFAIPFLLAYSVDLERSLSFMSPAIRSFLVPYKHSNGFLTPFRTQYTRSSTFPCFSPSLLVHIRFLTHPSSFFVLNSPNIKTSPFKLNCPKQSYCMFSFDSRPIYSNSSIRCCIGGSAIGISI